MNIPDTPNRQVSLSNTADIVTDGDDIKQCIYTILTTVKGSDPLRPTFGSDVYRFIDMPMNTAAPNLVLEVYNALEKWEKRIAVTRCELITTGFDKRTIHIDAIVIASAGQIEIDIPLS